MIGDIHSSPAEVPENVNEMLTKETEIKSKVGHVAKYNNIEEKISYNDDEVHSTSIEIVYSNNHQQINLNQFQLSKKRKEFVGLNKEELKCFIRSLYWKRIRLLIGIFYLLLILFLLLSSILLILLCNRCPPKANVVWYEKEIIYEIDLKMFRDSNGDGIGDLKGVEQKLDYFEKNSIKCLLFRSTIFNSNKANMDLLKLNEQILNETQLEYFIKIVKRKNMHLIIDLPLSSTNDLNGYQWYGTNKTFSTKINNSCDQNKSDLACRYSTEYGRLPLDFNNKQVIHQSESRLHHWLLTKKMDGVRIDLPIELNNQTGLYYISYKTINRWNNIKNNIEKKTKPKLIFYDIPFGLNDFIIENDLQKKIIHPILLNQSFIIDSKQLNQRIQSFKLNHLSLPKFWKIGSMRINDEIENNFSKEMLLTMGMLVGGTPVILYGEELGLQQKINRLMLWTPEESSGGFSSCLTEDCLNLFSSYHLNISQTNVKREEAIGGNDQDSLLILFRYLSKVRQFESFQFGLLETDSHSQSNIFWFIREAPGHKGFIIIFNLNEKEKETVHLSLSNELIPQHIYCEYQWPKRYFSSSNQTHIKSENLFIHSQSINIFSWTPKIIKPNILFKKAKKYLAN